MLTDIAEPTKRRLKATLLRSHNLCGLMLLYALFSLIGCRDSGVTASSPMKSDGSTSTAPSTNNSNLSTAEQPLLASLPPAVRQWAESVSASPAYLSLRARQDRISKRGNLAIALCPCTLAPGVEAVVRLGQPGTHKRYVVVEAETLSDRVLLRASASAFSYEMSYEDDSSPVTITLHAGGAVSFQSEKYGHWAEVITVREEVTDALQETRRVVSSLRKVTAVVPGFGLLPLVSR